MWSQLMEVVLMEFFAHAKHKQIPVHPAVEKFDVMLNHSPSFAARVRSGCELSEGTFLGFYQGWVGTAEESMLLLSDSAPLVSAKSVCGWPGAQALLKRASRTFQFQSYAVALAQVDAGKGAVKSLVVSAIGPDGKFVGNELGRINDGRAGPFRGKHVYHEAIDEAERLLLPRAAKCEGEGGSANDRPANVTFVQIMHSGWYYLGVVTTATVASGEELLFDFSEQYWQTQRKLNNDMQRLSELCDHDCTRRSPSCAQWVRESCCDSCFLASLWFHGVREQARARTAVLQDLKHEATCMAASKRAS
jgi:hypothetical protein